MQTWQTRCTGLLRLCLVSVQARGLLLPSAGVRLLLPMLTESMGLRRSAAACTGSS